jgi:hypothetical protein
MYSVEEEDHMTEWNHYCTADNTNWSVAKNSSCNWCGLTESQVRFVEKQEEKRS